MIDFCHSEHLTLDVGGEGRHAEAWNLNPSPVVTVGPRRGLPIPRHIPGRADAIPLADASVACIIMERTPLTRAALREIARVIRPDGTIILRHADLTGFDPHRAALDILPGRASRRRIGTVARPLLETRFDLAATR